MAIFRGKVFCYKCNKKHKFKKRAKKGTYICSTYDNYGADTCVRCKIDESLLIWYVKGHFNIQEEDVTEEFVRKNISRIDVKEEGFKITYKNGEYSLLSNNKLIR